MRWETSFKTKEVEECLSKMTTTFSWWRAITHSWAWSFVISKSFNLMYMVTRKILAILSKEARRLAVTEMYPLHYHQKSSWTARNTLTFSCLSIRRNPTMTITSWLCLISQSSFSLNIIRSMRHHKVVISCLKMRMVITLSWSLVLPTSTITKPQSSITYTRTFKRLDIKSSHFILKKWVEYKVRNS